jgi:flagellar protein FliL
MRIAIIAVIALLVLGGGGVGAYFYFSQPAQASAGEEVGKNDKDHKKEAKKGGGGGHGSGEGGVEFVKLDPLILPIVNNDGLTQVVSLVVAIEVADAADKETVQKLVPRITDAFIQDMYGVLSTQGMKGGVIQVAFIKERLNKITARVLGDEIHINDVLLQVVQQRPA